MREREVCNLTLQQTPPLTLPPVFLLLEQGCNSDLRTKWCLGLNEQGTKATSRS